MFCSRCGATVAEGATHCPACGQPTAGMAVIPPGGSPAVPVSGAAAAPYGAYATTPAMNYAGFWLRFVAYLIDVVVIWIVFMPIYLILAAALGLNMGSIAQNPDAAALGSAMGLFLGIEFLAIVGVWLYYALLESSGWQGTIGKKVLGLRVTDLNGDKITFGRATGRFFGKIISSFILMIGYIMAGFTEKKQALHDMLAGCLVLKKV
jgi:uncharacterized RDD family membrane protein YckC